MSDFKAGDIVKLKCHPQEMMVDSAVADERGKVGCVWIDDYGQPHREEYSPEVLEISDADALTVALRKKPTKMDTREGL